MRPALVPTSPGRHSRVLPAVLSGVRAICSVTCGQACAGLHTKVMFQGISYPRIRYGQETLWHRDGSWPLLERCSACFVKIGGLHHQYCVIEQCPKCGEQRVGCDCGK